LRKNISSEIPNVMKRVLNLRGINRSLKEISHARKEAEKGLDFQDLPKLLDEFWIQWNERILSNLHVKSSIQTAKFIKKLTGGIILM